MYYHLISMSTAFNCNHRHKWDLKLLSLLAILDTKDSRMPLTHVSSLLAAPEASCRCPLVTTTLPSRSSSGRKMNNYLIDNFCVYLHDFSEIFYPITPFCLEWGISVVVYLYWWQIGVCPFDWIAPFSLNYFNKTWHIGVLQLYLYYSN